MSIPSSGLTKLLFFVFPPTYNVCLNLNLQYQIVFVRSELAENTKHHNDVLHRLILEGVWGVIMPALPQPTAHRPRKLSLVCKLNQ